jgi:hypothetical protein
LSRPGAYQFVLKHLLFGKRGDGPARREMNRPPYLVGVMGVPEIHFIDTFLSKC